MRSNAVKRFVGDVIPESKYHIQDWAGNVMYNMGTFETFDDAESYLCEVLGDNYETDRQEYYITES